MEALQTLPVSKITKQLESDKPSTIYLDVLNRLLGTVNNWIISNRKNKKNFFDFGIFCRS